jgi:hypothetical protein
MSIRTGDLVEVRSREEILRTLDDRGAKNNLPFMPEMLRFCGRRFRVQAVAHKTCDTVLNQGGRRMHDTVHLEELRCDGAAHGGCQAGCLLFWKHDWLKKVDASTGDGRAAAAGKGSCTEERLEESTRTAASSPDRIIYSCQATRLLEATTPLQWWDLRQYLLDVTNRNVRFGHAVRVLFLAWLRAFSRIGIGYRVLRKFYERIHVMLTGKHAPEGAGQVPDGEKTPSRDLDLRPGEWVRVRPYQEILGTLNRHSKNRGLWFDDEMTQYCGESHRVVGRVERIINEKSGEMMQFRNPNIVLEGLNCTGTYTRLRLLCPRRVVTYWREIWLERVEARSGSEEGSDAPQHDASSQRDEPVRRAAGC